jgi:uncharacterized protein (TIGR04141 family)
MNSDDILTSKLSIYLLKDAVDVVGDIFDESIDSMTIDGAGRLYVLPSNSKQPVWVTHFFGVSLENQADLRIYTASARAVLIVEDIGGRKFAAMTGRSKLGFENFGKIVSGKDALYVNVKIDYSNIRDFLSRCYERYLSEDYKASFDWIDQISEVDDKRLISNLNDGLVEKLVDDDRDHVWAATPEQIEWSEIKGFSYKKFAENEELEEDISLSKIIAEIGREDLTLEKLRRTNVFAISSETNQVTHKWSVFNCMYAEIERDGATFLMTNGKWYRIDNDFVERVNRDCASIPMHTVLLPDYAKTEHGNENGYNKVLAKNLDGICFDSDNIPYGGGHSSIEFCDVYSKDKTIIHIKHYSGSSPLSHLFSQGSVSGELFKNDPEFRALVNEKLSDELKMDDPAAEYQPFGQKIVFGIITHQSAGLTLPFFSKVNIRTARRLLNGFGFQVELAAITNQSSE